MLFRKLKTSLIVFALAIGCSKREKVDGLDPDVEETASYTAIEMRPELAGDELRQQLASVFLVEQFSATVKSTMLEAIREHQPGGIVFWNNGGASYHKIRQVISAYAKEASSAGHANILFSTDYEGGILKYTPKGSDVIGIQRFRDGFTALAHPVWLGKGTAEQSQRLCYLHGKIIAKEMASVGLNYPLSVVSDLAKRLFANRGISQDPVVVSACLQKITDAFVEQGNVIFVTKHFPGLASTEGDTHDTVATSDVGLEELKQHILPFTNTINYVNSGNTWVNYSIMSGHGFYPALDDTQITTESSVIVTDLLRKKLGFKGLAVSDAMWMGSYGSLGPEALNVVYLNTFLSGADLLMIPGSRFAQAITYFRDVFDDTLTDKQKKAVEKRTGLDWKAVRVKFTARLRESLQRLNDVRAIAVQKQGSQAPQDETISERIEYYKLLIEIDERWEKRLVIPK